MSASTPTAFPRIDLASASELAEAIQVSLFLPNALDGYYRSSRFDWGTMIGDVRSGRRRAFCSDVWRQPHDPLWTESGVGLASEWGCGVDGAWCPSGWAGGPEVNNGVLGFDEASIGEPFLKIGVGLLAKGSCAVCNASDPHDAYHFNSPYRFVSPPTWQVHRTSAASVELVHEAQVRRHAYRLRRSLTVGVSSLTVVTTLENRGAEAFSTPYYSHNFLSVDGHGPGPGWALSLGGLNVSDYADSPPWAAPLADVFRPTADAKALRATSTPLDEPTKVKATYAADLASRGSWTAVAPNGFVVGKTMHGPLPLYAYNLYLEHATLSPEPIQLVSSLAPGQHVTLTQQVSIRVEPGSFGTATHYRAARGSGVHAEL